ncbi:MAG: GNAT family N-acetyltransferase [Parafilimonas sp.]
MNIFSSNEADIEELTQVEIESKRQSIPECVEDYEIDFDSRRQRWQTYFKGQSPQTSKPQRIVLKAVTNGKIAGYLAGHLTTRYNFGAEIQSFYILKSAQNKKIGTELLISFVHWLTGTDAKSLCVGINPENRYKRFYLKYGGEYFNAHWIYWNDLTRLLQRLTQEKT